MVRPPPPHPNRLNFGDSLDVMRGHISRLLFLIFLLLLTACTTPAPDPTVTSTSELVPIQTATPTPTATAATPTLTPEPTTTAQRLTVEEYAAACGEVMGQSVDTQAQRESDALQMAKLLGKLEPPPEFREFHGARTARFSTQVPDGPNDATQAAYDLEIEIVAEMPGALRQMLIDEWCLLEVQVLYGANALAAKARMALPLERPVTVEGYAQRCSDIQSTLPIMGDFDAALTHIITHWRELEPPPGAEAYHDALLKAYIEWHETGSADPANINVQVAGAEAKKLGPDFVEQLYRGGCLQR